MAECIKRKNALRQMMLVETRENMFQLIKNFPTADIVKVVRCKECINHTNSGVCEGWSRYGAIQTSDDAFCSYGVKRNV